MMKIWKNAKKVGFEVAQLCLALILIASIIYFSEVCNINKDNLAITIKMKKCVVTQQTTK